MTYTIERAATAAVTTAGRPELVVAVAAVLSRCGGTDRVTVHDPSRPQELSLPREASAGRALAGLRLSKTGPTTIITTDPAGRRHSAHIDGAGRMTWVWAASADDNDPPAAPAPDATADARVRRVLRQVLTAPATALRDLPVLTAAERECHRGIGRPARPGDGINVVDALHRNASAHPTRPAIVDDSGPVSYADLDRRVARCAATLRGYGLGSAEAVALVLPRSVGLAVAILAALRAGTAFTVINPTAPPARIRRLVADCGARLVVAEASAGLDALPADVITPAQLIERAPEKGPAAGPGLATEPGLGAGADDATRTAYILFTSGSTGHPKGVSVARRALWSYLAAVSAAYRLSPDDRVLQLAEPGFDVMLEEILPVIAAGGCVAIGNATCLDSPKRFLAQVRRHRVTVVNLPSSLWITLLQRDGAEGFAALPTQVRLVVAGSERMPAAAYLAWHRSMPARIRLVNAYGTTETTVTSLVYSPDDQSLDTVRRTGAVPIGRPLANTAAWVVDAFDDPCPFGVPGELVLGGDSVCRGYLDAAGTRSAGTRYHTGDRVYLDRTGVVVHIGRSDGQLKVRGRRIEPAEIEGALESLPGVRRALCTDIGDAHEARLVAVVVASGTARVDLVDPAYLLAGLARLLPGWLLPDQVVLTGALPINDRGKVDRAAVRRLVRRCGPTPAALTGSQRAVAECVSDLLGCPTPGPDDNFYALGGTSLQAIRLVVRLCQRTGVELSAQDVLRDPTIAAIARAVDAAPVTANLVRRPDRESYPLTASQRAMVRFLTRTGTWLPYFEMWEGFRLTGLLDTPALHEALRAAVREHEPLRTVVDPDTMTARVLPDWVPTLRQVDLSGLAPAARADALHDELEQARRPFDLGREAAFRPVLIRLGAEEHVLSLTLHHLHFDGWSYGLLYERLAALYAGSATAGQQVRPEFGDYAARQAAQSDAATTQRDLDYWRGVLGGHRPPQICHQLTASEANSVSAAYTVDAATARGLDSLAAAVALTPFALLQAAFAMVLAAALAHHDLLIAANDANRYLVGTEHLVGYLATSLLSRFRLRGTDTFLAIARRAHADLTSSREHLSVQWEDLVNELELTGAVQFRFSLQDSTTALSLPGLAVTALPDMVIRRGKRAVAVVAWRRPDGYEMRWYAREDAVVLAPADGLASLSTVLARAVADPGLTVAGVAELVSRQHRGGPDRENRRE